MSHNISKGDWFKHLHVQVASWEEKGVHTRSPFTRGCTCKKSCIDGIKHCLTKRLNLCKIKNLIPKVYEGEVDAFFEFLKHEKFDTKCITKLVQRRSCVVCLMNFLVSFERLYDFERQQVIDRFETHNIKNLVESVHTLIDVLRSTLNIHSGVSPESYTKTETRFNDTTWLRHMYRLCLMILNKVEGRVKWEKVHNGVDPNNAHTNPVKRTKQEFTRRETLISELRSLVPRCLQPLSCPRPYREEVQLLLAFLEEGVLDKKKIQQGQKLRKLAIGLNDALLKVLKMGNDLNEIIKNIEPSRRGQFITCLADLGHRLEVLSQNTDELQAFSEDEHPSNQSNHDCETDRRNEPSADAIGYTDEENAADPVTEKMMNVSNPKATSNGSKEEMIDIGKNSEPSCSHEKTYDLTVLVDEESNDSLLLPLGLLSDSTPTQHFLDLEQEVTHYPLNSDNILDQSFHQLLDAAKAIVAVSFHDDCLDIVDTQEHQLSGDNISGQEDITVLNPVSEDYRRMADLTQSSPADSSTRNTSYAASDLTLSETIENVSQSPSAVDFTEVDPSNEDAVLDLWSGLGDDVINTIHVTKLWKVRERIQGLDTVIEKRLQETALQSEVEPDLHGKLEENHRNTRGRKRKRSVVNN